MGQQSKSRSLALLLAVLLVSSFALSIRPVSGVDAAADTWVTKAPMPTARSGLGVAVVDDKIYAIGGHVLVYQDQFKTQSKDVGTNEVYDPTTNTWQTKTPMPVPSSYFTTAVYDGKIYCIGGGVTDVFNQFAQGWETKIGKGFNLMYDPTTDKWENKTAMPIAQIRSCANLIEEKIYFIGGYPNSSLNEMYNPANDEWTIMAPLPAGFNGASVVFKNQIYAIGNMNWKTPQTMIYSPKNNSWSILETSQDFIGQSIAVATSGTLAPQKIYVFYIELDAPMNAVIKTKVFDPQTNSWEAGAQVPSTRGRGYAAAVSNDLIYVIGGYTATTPSIISIPQGPKITYLATVEEYVPFGYGTVVATPTPSIQNNPSNLQPIDYLLPISVLLAIAVIVSFLLFRRKPKAGAALSSKSSAKALWLKGR